jgi:hypothetical protein
MAAATPQAESGPRFTLDVCSGLNREESLMRRSTWLLVACTLSVLGVLAASACDKETDLGNVPLSPYVPPEDSGSDSGPADTGPAPSSGDSATTGDAS